MFVLDVWEDQLCVQEAHKLRCLLLDNDNYRENVGYILDNDNYIPAKGFHAMGMPGWGLDGYLSVPRTGKKDGYHSDDDSGRQCARTHVQM